MVPPETLLLDAGSAVAVLTMSARKDDDETCVGVREDCDWRVEAEVLVGAASVEVAVRIAISTTARVFADGLAKLSEEKVAFIFAWLTLRNGSAAISQQTLI
jgi:hypothetical protein